MPATVACSLTPGVVSACIASSAGACGVSARETRATLPPENESGSASRSAYRRRPGVRRTRWCPWRPGRAGSSRSGTSAEERSPSPSRSRARWRSGSSHGRRRSAPRRWRVPHRCRRCRRRVTWSECRASGPGPVLGGEASHVGGRPADAGAAEEVADDGRASVRASTNTRRSSGRRSSIGPPPSATCPRGRRRARRRRRGPHPRRRHVRGARRPAAAGVVAPVGGGAAARQGDRQQDGAATRMRTTEPGRGRAAAADWSAPDRGAGRAAGRAAAARHHLPAPSATSAGAMVGTHSVDPGAAS